MPVLEEKPWNTISLNFIFYNVVVSLPSHFSSFRVCISFYFNLSFLSLFFYANIIGHKDWNFRVVSCIWRSWLLFSIGSIKGLLLSRIEVFSFRVLWKALLKEIWIVHLVKRNLQISFPSSMVPSNVLNVSFPFCFCNEWILQLVFSYLYAWKIWNSVNYFIFYTASGQSLFILPKNWPGHWI